MKNLRPRGRPSRGDSAWTEYEATSRSEVMRRVAIGARRRGMSMVRFAELAGKPRETIVNAFFAKKPRSVTIDACCDALALDAMTRRAIVDQNTERDVASIVRTVANAQLIESRDNLAGLPEAVLHRAARAFILAEHDLSEDRDKFAAFLKAIANESSGDSTVEERLFRRQNAYPERVLECLEMIHQRVPAASSFTIVDDNMVLAVLVDYVAPTGRRSGQVVGRKERGGTSGR